MDVSREDCPPSRLQPIPFGQDKKAKRGSGRSRRSQIRQRTGRGRAQLRGPAGGVASEEGSPRGNRRPPAGTAAGHGFEDAGFQLRGNRRCSPHERRRREVAHPRCEKAPEPATGRNVPGGWRMITKTEWQGLHQQLMADERKRMGDPPTAEEVLAYMSGELSAEEEERIRERLVCYPELVRTLTAPF